MRISLGSRRGPDRRQRADLPAFPSYHPSCSLLIGILGNFPLLPVYFKLAFFTLLWDYGY